MGVDLEMESGPGSRTEARLPLAHRDPALVRHREASSPSSVRAVRPRVPEPLSPTVSYKSDDVDQNMLQVLSGSGSNAVDSLERQLTKSASPSITSAEPTAYIKPFENLIIPNPSMRDHFDAITVRPGCERRQLYSCVANGGLYNEADIRSWRWS